MLTLLVLTARFVEPMTEAGMLGSPVQRTRDALARFAEVLAAEPLPEPAEPQRPGTFGITFDRVSFGYAADAGTPVLRDVSFSIPEHSMTALVGPSGSGKTTVTRLITRFWDTGSGAVRVGGADARDIGTDELMSTIAVVFQDVYLFSGSIWDNIRIGKLGATDGEVREAARLARVDEIAARLPDGWQTQVGEGGTALSGGERQRVSIARAILKDAPIILLDEATAALDPENEQAVHQALSALTANRTLLVIAHRLQTVMAADQILVLDDELIGLGGWYAAFWAERDRARG